jgi:hypothetical protein
VFGIALGNEDLNDHELLRYDPVSGLLLGKLTATRPPGALAAKPSLNQLELPPLDAASRYHKIQPTRRRSSGCSGICIWTLMPRSPRRSSSTPMRRTIRRTGIGKGGYAMVTRR